MHVQASYCNGSRGLVTVVWGTTYPYRDRLLSSDLHYFHKTPGGEEEDIVSAYKALTNP